MAYATIEKKRAYHAAYNRRDRESRWAAEFVPKSRAWVREDIAWAAGVFEGEGCFSFSTHPVRPNKVFTARLSMTDKDVVDRFARAVKFGRIGTRRPYQSHHLPQYTWTAHGFETVQALAAAFWPWLGMRRRAKIREIAGVAKTYFATKTTNGKPRYRFRKRTDLIP